MSKARLMQGNEACAEGAIAAGVNFFAGYPITPSTEIAETMARLLPKHGGKFVQMEDEIASMGAILGASLAGSKVMDATSGPGFSLKQELIGYAACAEIPCVLVDVQRVGPSTGQPTSPSQGDVMQARWGTHGDHPIIALAPWSVRETYDATVMAVNYAERFRTPVILLMDEVIGHLREKVELPEHVEVYPRRKPKKSRAEGYEPFAPDEDLVPNVADFGQGYRIHVTGLIHDDTGFPSGSPEVTEASIRRLHEKIARAGEEIIHTESYFMDDAEYAVVSFGGSARTAYEAVCMEREKGRKVGMLRLMTIWPFADKAIEALSAKVKGILVAELNYGQIVHEVRRAAHSDCKVTLCGKYDMKSFEPADITRYREYDCRMVRVMERSSNKIPPESSAASCVPAAQRHRDEGHRPGGREGAGRRTTRSSSRIGCSSRASGWYGLDITVRRMRRAIPFATGHCQSGPQCHWHRHHGRRRLHGHWRQSLHPRLPPQCGPHGHHVQQQHLRHDGRPGFADDACRRQGDDGSVRLGRPHLRCLQACGGGRRDVCRALDGLPRPAHGEHDRRWP